MGDFKINLLKSYANTVTSKFLEIITSCFFSVPYIQQPTRVAGSSATLIDNMNKYSDVMIDFSITMNLKKEIN